MKRILLAILAFFFGSLRAAVTVESSATPVTVVAAQIILPHTCTAATALVVGFGAEVNSAVTDMAYNGDALTKLNGLANGAGIGRSELWMMVSPDLGSSYNVVINFASDSAVAGAVGLLGTVTTSVAAAHRNTYTGVDGASGPSVTVTDSVSGDLVIDSATTFSTTIAVAGGATSRGEDDAIAGGTVSWGMSTKVASGASTVMSWTGGAFTASVGTAMIASGAAPSASGFFRLF